MKNCIIIALLALNIAPVLPTFHCVYREWLIYQLVIFHILTIPVAFILGQPLAIISSGVIYVVRKTTFSEFKRERIDHLYDTKTLHAYDVVAIQELYGGWFPGSRFYQHHMRRQCEKAGLKHSATAGRPVLPRVIFDQGLAIFSRYPIVKTKRLVFKKQSIWDYLFVARACLYVQVEVNPLHTVHCFTVHTAPSLKDMQERSSLARLLKEKVPTVQVQANEIADFIKKMTKTGYKERDSGVTETTVCMGDFNIGAGTADFIHLENELGAGNNLNMTEISSQTDRDGKRTWASTFGRLADGSSEVPTETLLTSPGLRGKPQTLDFVFVTDNCRKVGECVVHPFAAVKESDKKYWQQVSDHCGLSARIELQKTK